MPIYEYECKKCNTVFEIIVSSSSLEDVKCEKCGSSEVRKLISAAGIKVSKGDPLPSSSNCQARGGFT
jgi:putative FmdB family regulatory protein